MSDQEKKLQCYTYARISTQTQAGGYSLDMQREQLRRESEHRGMAVAGEFSDVGPSGDRPQFAEMMHRIQDGNPDGVAYVMVTKLSRFCRDTADVLSSFQLMQDHGVNLIAADEGIDSAAAEGKLMFHVLAGVVGLKHEAVRA